jgi:anti-anti-sigma factor
LGTISVRRHGSLALRVEQDRNALTLRAVGELDIDSAALVEQSLLRAFEGGAESIVLDLTAVSFIDAAGLRMLMWAAECSREDGGRLRMDCGSAAIHHMLDTAQLDRDLADT